MNGNKRKQRRTSGAVGVDSYGRIEISAALRTDSIEASVGVSDLNYACAPNTTEQMLRVPGREADSGTGCVCVQYKCS